MSLASVPRLIALIGIALLSIGILASGYLATGGVGAYLASLSAGAIMGIGASFIMIQSEKILQKHFRIKLPIASTFINIAFTTGLIIAPLVALALFTRLGIQAGLMAMVLFFFPTLIAIGFLKVPGNFFFIEKFSFTKIFFYEISKNNRTKCKIKVNFEINL